MGERAGKEMEKQGDPEEGWMWAMLGLGGGWGGGGGGQGKMTRLGSQALGSWGDGGAGSTSKRVGPLAAGRAPPFPAQLGSAL